MFQQNNGVNKETGSRKIQETVDLLQEGSEGKNQDSSFAANLKHHQLESECEHGEK